MFQDTGNLTVWGRRSSSNVQAVMWCIAELNLECKRIDAGLTYGHTDSAAYLAMNPNGKVPTLCDGDSPPIWESGAILRYLASAYADERFWPENPVERAKIDKWAEWSKLNVASEFTGPIFWRVVRTPVARRDTEAVKKAVRHLEKNLRLADSQLQESEYLASEHLTLADIQLGHVLFRYYDIGIDRADDLHNVARYYEMLTQRGHFQAHVMVGYEELVDTL